MIEELLVGDEVSLLALCHGQAARPLAAAQDFKRVGDGDTGPNTGGMGAYSPVPWFDSAATAEAARLVHEPLLAELARRGIPFSGCLYAGLMLTADGPRVLEYNVRFGDPETQALVARFDGDLAAALHGDRARRARRRRARRARRCRGHARAGRARAIPRRRARDSRSRASNERRRSRA